MKRIYCQSQTNCREGCPHCGGYGYLVEEIELSCCERDVWVRPGVFTSFDGKRWTTFDGVEMVESMAGRRCAECDAKAGGAE